MLGVLLSMNFTGICCLKNQSVPNFNFPCLFTDYGSDVPEVKRVPVSSRTHALNYLYFNVKTPWILLIYPLIVIINELPELDNNFDVIYSKGYFGSNLKEPDILSYCYFIKTQSFPILDNNKNEYEALDEFIKKIKKLKIKEVEPFWSFENS